MTSQRLKWPAHALAPAEHNVMLLPYCVLAALCVQTVNYGLTITTLFVFAGGNQEELEPAQYRMLDPVSGLLQ